MVTDSVGTVAFGNPQMVVTLPGPTIGRKAVGCQDATIEELAEKDLAEDCLYRCDLLETSHRRQDGWPSKTK